MQCRFHLVDFLAGLMSVSKLVIITAQIAKFKDFLLDANKEAAHDKINTRSLPVHRILPQVACLIKIEIHFISSQCLFS